MASGDDASVEGRDIPSVDETITVVLKNPRALAEENFEVNVAADMTLDGLKKLIESDYPGNPSPGSLTLVYAGKVLREEGLVLSDVFPKDGDRVAVHMVVKSDDQMSTRDIESRSTRTQDESMVAGPPLEEVREEASIPTLGNRHEGERPSSPVNVPSTSRSSSTMYDSVLRASYQAALRVIMEEGVQGSAPPGFTFIPAIIPVPMEGQHRDDEQNMNPYMVPMVPLTYAFPRAQQDHQDHVLRQRRRRDAQDENVRALFRVLREGAQNNNRDGLQRRGNGRNPRQIQIRIRLNIRMLLQVAVLSFILYQHCPPSRFVGIGLLALMFYFSTTRFGRMLLRRVTGHFNMQRQGGDQQRPPQAGAANDPPSLERNDDQNRDEEREPEAPEPGLLQEIQSFIAGFFASILPAADQQRNADNAGVVQDVFRGQ